MTPVGIVEVAERLGVKRGTVDKWRERSQPLVRDPVTGLVRRRKDRMPVPFPQPKWQVGGSPAWDWQDIKRWARKTHRL